MAIVLRSAGRILKSGLGLAILMYLGQAAASGPAGAPASPNSFAVLELFTSEGCSSTPPAEQVINEVVAAARRTGRRVFALAFHVHYWDGLGWRDLFGRPANTD